MQPTRSLDPRQTHLDRHVCPASAWWTWVCRSLGTSCGRSSPRSAVEARQSMTVGSRLLHTPHLSSFSCTQRALPPSEERQTSLHCRCHSAEHCIPKALRWLQTALWLRLVQAVRLGSRAVPKIPRTAPQTRREVPDGEAWNWLMKCNPRWAHCWEHFCPISRLEHHGRRLLGGNLDTWQQEINARAALCRGTFLQRSLPKPRQHWIVHSVL